MKNIIEENLLGTENIDFIDVNIKNTKDKEERIYYILRFNKLFDVIDKEKTRYNKITGDIIMPRFDEAKYSKYSIFTYYDNEEYNFWKITTSIYISEKMKKNIVKAKLTGIRFS